VPPLQSELAVGGGGAGAGVAAGVGEAAAGDRSGAKPGGRVLTGGAISPLHADAEYVFFGFADADAAKATVSPTATTPTRTPCVTRERMRVRAPAGSPRSARRRRHCAGFAEAADRNVRTRAIALIAGPALHQLCRSGTHGTWPNHIDRPPACICVSLRQEQQGLPAELVKFARNPQIPVVADPSWRPRINRDLGLHAPRPSGPLRLGGRGSDPDVQVASTGLKKSRRAYATWSDASRAA